MEELKLDLSRHCIETEIKKRYNHALSEYFRAKTGQARLEEIIDMTRQALQSFDFNRLRSRYAPLAGKTDAEIVLARDKGLLSILVDGQPIDL